MLLRHKIRIVEQWVKLFLLEAPIFLQPPPEHIFFVPCEFLQKYFTKVVRMRVDASRSMSREFYAVGLGRKKPLPLER